MPLAAWSDCKVAAIELPVMMSGSRAIVTVGINGKDVKLMLDSGAFMSFLSRATAAQLGLEVTPTPATLKVEGLTGEVDTGLTRVKRLGLLNGEIPDIEFLVGGNEVGSGAMGLIGRNVLNAMDVEYDLANGVIRLMQLSGDCSGKNMAYWAGTTPVSVIPLLRDDPRTTALPLDLRNDPKSRLGPLQAIAMLNGKNIRVLFDTGATSTVSLTAAKAAGVQQGDMRAAGLVAGAGSKSVPAWTARFDTFELGAERIVNNRLTVADFTFEKTDMLVGIDYFLSHRIYVSLSQRRLYVTYNGGAVFARNVSEPADPSASAAGPAAASAAAMKDAEAPIDASDYARRGMASASRHNYRDALSDFDRACELDPHVADYYARRGMVQLALKDPSKARSDFDEALRLDPAHADARLQRAALRVSTLDRDGALDDLATLDRSLHPQASMRRDLAHLYGNLHLEDRALAQWDLWIAAHPKEATLDSALNGRCWARAMLGVDLDKAMADCNAALDKQPGAPDYLDSRGWVELRQGRYRESVTDFERALKERPKQAWSLYGRGIARIRLGDEAQGRADVEAAREAMKSIDEVAGGFGISVP